MKNFHAAIAMVIAFTLAYAGTPRDNEELQAQNAVPCNCSWLAGSTGPNTIACLGTANISSASCSQFGNQCFLSGWATWQPATLNCLIAGPTMGAITTTGAATGGPSYFDPAGAPPYPKSIPWGALTTAACGSPSSFGAVMQVVHNTWTGGTSCTCVPSTPTLSSALVSTVWRCKV